MYKKIILLSLISFSLFISYTFAEVFSPSSCNVLSSTDLVTEMTDQIDSRITGLSTSTGYMSLYSTRGTDTGPWIKDTNVWSLNGDTPLDFSGQSVWNSTDEYLKAGTLISPKHVVFANHYSISNGATIVFIDRNGDVVSRTLVNSTRIGTTDIQVGILNEDVPNTVAYYPLISDTQLDNYIYPRNLGIFSSSSLIPIPMVVLDQDDQVIIRNFDEIHTENQFETNDNFLSSSEQLFYKIHINGDSGSPGFFVVDGQLLLTYVAHYPLSGDFYGSLISEINSAMTTLQGGSNPYQVSTYDLSCFSNVDQVNFTFNIDEFSDLNTVVGEVSGTSTYSDVDITYSIISGNTGNAFSISSSTGLITVANRELLDYETNPVFNLVVKGLETVSNPGGGSNIYNSYASVQINLNNILSFTTSEEWLYDRATYRNWIANGYAYGENLGWIKFSPNSDTSVYVSDNGLTGYLYSESAGWISLSCRNASTCDYINYGILNDGLGNLSEYAWGENIGWIHFGSSTSPYRVLINSDGTFSGYAWNEATGYINFNANDYSATTTWVYKTSRKQCDDGVDNTGNGEVDYPEDSLCFSLSDDFERPTGHRVSEIIPSSDSSSVVSVPLIVNNNIPTQPLSNTPPQIVIPQTPVSIQRNIFFSRSLTLGSEDSEVSDLQNFLIQNGYEILSGPTGYFGSQTKKALSLYQSKNGIIPSSGFFGPITRNYINGGVKKEVGIQNSSKYIFTKNLELNNSGEDVRQLQMYLNSKGFIISTNGIGSKGNESLIYGTKTAQAVKKYQEFYRDEILTPNGLRNGTGMFYDVTREHVNKN